MGCGKTTIGKTLEEKLNWPFFDADDFHPESNKQKMATVTHSMTMIGNPG